MRLLLFLVYFLLTGCCENKAVHVQEMNGIDISHFQGLVDWNQLQDQSIQFVIIKASQGNHYIDKHYQSNWKKSQSTTLWRGAYHYLDPEYSGISQALHFIKTTQGNFGEFAPVVDLEAFEDKKVEDVIGVLAEYLAIIEQKTGCLAIIYTSPNFWRQLDDHDYGRHALWLADYAEKPQIPNGWKTWSMWQYTNKGKIQGINGLIDKSKLHYSGTPKKPIFCDKRNG